MYQGAHALNDLHLSFDNLTRNEFFQLSHVPLRLAALAKLKREPLPIGGRVAAHEQHNSHYPGREFA